MDTRDAAALLAPAIPKGGGVWADLGAGTGTFTRALAELLGPGARVYAVDRDARALESVARWAGSASLPVIPVTADFTEELELPGLDEGGLDGVLLANALHFVPDPERVLARLVQRVRPGGTIVLVEYDGRAANRWVPYPISRARLVGLATAAGLGEPTVLDTRPSAYGGQMYVASANRLTVQI